MALLQDFEPPSNKSERENNLDRSNTSKQSLLVDSLFNLRENIISGSLSLGSFFVNVKDFFQGGKYLPHFALIFLALIVSITNISSKMAAKAYSEEIITVNPDIEYSVAQGVEPFTPLIKDSSNTVQKSILASAMSDGFVSNTASVATELTQVEPVLAPVSENDNKTIDYIVQNGDTMSGLGMKFDLKVATLKYVNNIDNENMLKPGAKLKIPPKGYQVSASALAKAEKDKKAKLAAAARNTVTRDGSGRTTGKAQAVNVQPGAKANGYPYGWCTYYVATRRYVPTSWGNAKSWLSSAKRAGYATGSEPAAGAIMVTSESGWGHVAYVESVNGDTITVSEMNYQGWGVVSRRTLSANAGVVRGFVY